MNGSNDGSESVDQFLARIGSIKGKDETSAASRRMDEEFLKGRSERQARRLERARSISPSKTGPVTTPLTLDSPATTSQTLNPPVDFSPQSKNLSRSNAVTGRISPTRIADASPTRTLPSPSATKESTAPAQTATGLARSGTLSWAQRPASRDGARQRPLSGFASVRSLPKPADDEKEDEPSRTDIASSLAQKDPTWFRQTQDRGLGSAAFRKNQVEDAPEPLTSKSVQLPGMTRSREPSKSPVPESRREPELRYEEDRFKRGTTPDIAALRMSMKEKPPSLRPTSQDTLLGGSQSTDHGSPDDTTATSSLGRTSSTLSKQRPASPTKGLGGFVESAMMKRSDSVSKRWSVRAAPGLQRGDSVAAGRPQSFHNRGYSKDITSPRADTPSSPLATSRPGSSHMPAATASPQPAAARDSQEPQAPRVDGPSPDQSIEPESPSQAPKRPQTPPSEEQLSRSPSKTMDPRRWSPTKSSWLESALQQEPPKLQPVKEEQPKWKVDLQRSRSRASRDVSPGKPPLKEEVETKLNTATSPAPRVDASPAPRVDASAAIQRAVPSARNVETKPANVMGSRRPADSPIQPPKTPEPAKPIVVTGDLGTGTPKLDKTLKEDEIPELDEASKKLDTLQETAVQSSKQPPVLKPKPQTPPKTDFRATLKSRNAEPTPDRDAEPEFKSMFGKLKRATTQNYVAPDELKNNIMSGKGALNKTDGPVKTKRVDEFKESILAKKEEMKSGTPNTSTNTIAIAKTQEPIPEALARRKTLSKASAIDATRPKTSTPAIDSKVFTKPVTPPKPVSVRKPDVIEKQSDKPTAVVAVKQDHRASSTQAPGVAEQREKAKTTEKSALLPTSTSHPVPGVSPKSEQAETPTRNLELTGVSTETAAPKLSTTRLQSKDSGALDVSDKPGLPTNNKLVSRINPNLAAILSRSSSPRIQGSPDASMEDLSLKASLSASQPSASDDASLTHMTKARAKGPKRRAPKVEPAARSRSSSADLLGAVESSAASPGAVAAPKRPKSQQAPTTAVSTLFNSGTDVSKSAAERPKPARAWGPSTSSVRKPQSSVPGPSREPSQPKSTSGPEPDTNGANFKQEKSATEVVASSTKEKPQVASKSPELRKVSSPFSMQDRLQTSTKPVTPQKSSFSVAAQPSPKPETPAKSETISMKPDVVPTPMSTPVKQPIPYPTIKKDSRPIAQMAKYNGVQGLGLKMSPSPQATNAATKPRVLTPPPDREVKSPAPRPDVIRSILDGYVGTIGKDHDRAEFDAQQFLTAGKHSPTKIRTTHHAIYEISGDGKKTALPSQQQHILHEESMYLVVHKFAAENGTATSEVNLWCGDRVSDAAVEDVQIFCRRDAREHGTKLEVVKQGKESANFIQAFGGILITRRTKSSALYMLCGRRHLGHIVFDEVDIDASSLCPGYTFLVSAPYGKLFLWKGKGAGADEIGSARLIGTDLGLTGEIEEIDQGSEPGSFWDAVGGRKQVEWSNDWLQRSDMHGFPTVMYRVEHERPGMLSNLTSWGLKRAASPSKQQVKATCERLQSFCQSDLEHPAIHILDAYRTLYVVMTRQCASKTAEFITALYLAQDFAMLSPAIQNRPALPACYVVAGDLPNDVKACFRKWSAIEASSLVGKDSICARLEDVMEALDL